MQFSQLLKFILLFSCTLPITHLVDNLLQMMLPMEMIHKSFNLPAGTIVFVGMNLAILPFIKTLSEVVWFIITITHGLAHIFHPAFHGTIVNDEYTPLFDFFVHSAQCLCVWHYHPRFFPLGIYLMLTTMVAGVMSHLDSTFLQTYFWIILSFGGIFGAYYHHFLLDSKKNDTIFVANLIIWTFPYLGYLYPPIIPCWDNWMNIIGVFRLWFFHYFFVHYFYIKYDKSEMTEKKDS